MSDPIFDSRNLDAWSYFCSKLGVGNYTIASAINPALNGALVVSAAAGNPPASYFPSIVFTVDGQGNLAFSAPPPFAATDATFITFSYSSASDSPIAYNVQISGTASLDSRMLMPDQLIGYWFQSAGSFTYKAYLLTPGPPGSTVPPQYVLKQQGDITVQNDAPLGAPIVIALDAATPIPAPVVTPTGAPVSWEANGGPWYVVVAVKPSGP